MSMMSRRTFGTMLGLAPWAICRPLTEVEVPPLRPTRGTRAMTLLFTNDFHSAFEPVPAFWLAGSPRLGGAAQLATLVERERAAAETTFLLDSGDMFTGTLSKLTDGEALLEMMRLMRYDAMGVGNHEFDYGWQTFDRGMTRVPFPILCCNIRYRGSGVRFTRPHTILERNGVRLGVIGVMGSRAARNTIMRSKVEALEFTDPVVECAASVHALRDQVDAIVVLGHQGLPGPMQSDAEADPAVQRTLDEDLAFCGVVPGIDVYIAAHSHRGLETPIRHPETGTLLTQTFGYGTRLGRVRLSVADGRVVASDATLLKVWSDDLLPHPAVATCVARYRTQVADQIGPPVGRAASRLTRKYHTESSLGSYVCDVLRAKGGAEIGLTNAGGLRADLPEGPLDRGHVLDALPFLNDAVTVAIPGGALRRVLEHGMGLEAGICQVSGLVAEYDPTRPPGARLGRVRVGNAPLDDAQTYRVTTNSFLVEGGDGYAGFLDGRVIARDGVLSDVILDHLRRTGTISPPAAGRLVPTPA